MQLAFGHTSAFPPATGHHRRAIPHAHPVDCSQGEVRRVRGARPHPHPSHIVMGEGVPPWRSAAPGSIQPGETGSTFRCQIAMERGVLPSSGTVLWKRLFGVAIGTLRLP